jgi:type I restriction enzyme S subunit
MNADELLRHFEGVADAPDAAPRLRAFCLRLALQGKLTGDGDETWAEAQILDCLEPLGDGKKIHQGWSPQCEASPSPSEDVWGVLRTTAIQDGYFLQAENKRLPDSLVPKPHLEVQPDDILLTCAGPRARCGIVCRVSTTRPRLMISGKMYRFRANKARILPEFLALLLRGEEAQGAINLMKTGSSESGLNLTQERFSSLRLRFGTLAEQKGIVAKVDELMALCDRLEGERAKREAARDRLTAAVLARLNTPDPETIVDDVRFSLDVLPTLTKRPDQIKQLRQTILNLAVRGRLVTQVAGDESATLLLERLVSSSGTSRRSYAVLSKVAEPYSIPDSWCWATLGQLIVEGPQNGISPKPSTLPDAPKAITLTATTSGTFNPDHFKRVDLVVPPNSDLWLRDGDLLFQRGNTREYVGMAAIYTGPPNSFLYPDLMIRVRVSPAVSLRYVHLVSIAPPARAYMSTNATGAQLTMPKINQSTLTALPIPLPPLEEQNRIVEKVDALLTLCDELEASLAAAELCRFRALEALIHEALEPVEATESA